MTTQRDAVLLRVALGELSGAFGREIRSDLEAASEGVFRALRDRLDRRLSENTSNDEPYLDEVDLALARTLLPIVLRRHDPREFAMVTRYTFADLVDLLDRANALIREVRIVSGYVTVQRGSCTVRLPQATIARNVSLVLAPDVTSWDGVMPACAQGRRDEFLEAARSYLEEVPGFRFEDRPAEKFEDLEAIVKVRRRAFLAERKGGTP